MGGWPLGNEGTEHSGIEMAWSSRSCNRAARVHSGPVRDGRPVKEPGGREGLGGFEVLRYAQNPAVTQLVDVEQPLTDLESAASPAAMDADRGDDDLARSDDLVDLIPGVVPRLQPPIQQISASCP